MARQSITRHRMFADPPYLATLVLLKDSNWAPIGQVQQSYPPIYLAPSLSFFPPHPMPLVPASPGWRLMTISHWHCSHTYLSLANMAPAHSVLGSASLSLNPSPYFLLPVITLAFILAPHNLKIFICLLLVGLSVKLIIYFF